MIISNSPFTAFFRNVKADEILLFTTFTLDEAVLVELLSQYGTKNQRIIVFHDVMKHRNPGFLKSKFPNAMVYSVELVQTLAKRCPVFHSKIWARIQVKEGRQLIRHMVVTSANLSPYHLTRREGGTLESYKCFIGINIPVPHGTSIFSSKLLSPSEQLLSRGMTRISLNPHSLIIDARRKLGVIVSDEPIVDFLQKLGTPDSCAGPFVCDSAILKRLSPSGNFKVFDGTNPKTGLALHAKIMTFENCLALGSVNWTAQAMGCLGKRSINHETLLILKSDQKIGKMLKGYPCRDLGTREVDIPCDFDPEDENSGDWLVERGLRIHAPEKALLVIERERAHIKLVGDFARATSMLVRSRQDDEQVILDVKNDVILEPQGTSIASIFASILEKGNVELIGQYRGKKVWRTFLDYGTYWAALEVQRMRRDQQGVRTGRRNKPAEIQGSANLDVRDMRQSVIRDPESGRSVVEFTRWLVRHKRSAVRIPLWCHELADRLNERSSQ